MPTTGYERFLKDGVPQTRQAAGLAFVPDPLPPQIEPGSLLLEVSEVLAQAQRELGVLAGLADDISVARILSAPLMRREASVSSKIEDTISTPEEVALYEAGQKSPRRDTVEVANYRRALGHGLQSELPLCIRLINEMHAILMEGTRGAEQRPGHIRTIQNRIGGKESDFSSARFVPPPPDGPGGRYLTDCLRALEKIWNNGVSPLPKLIVAGMAHYQFEVIHPYEDGNGRIGRLLIVLSLVRQRLIPEPLVYVSGHFDKNRKEYYDRLLAVSTHNDWPGWLQFFLEAIRSQAIDSADRISKIKQIRISITDKLVKSGAPTQMLPMIDFLIQNLATTVNSTRNLLGVSYPTARSYIERLETLGFLKEMTGKRKGQIWAAVPVLDIISEI